MRTLRLVATLALGGCTLTPIPQQQYPQQYSQQQEPYPAQESQQPVYTPPDQGTTINIDDIPPEEAAPRVDVFYDALAPYGRWEDDRRWGRVWIPSDASYRPYERGYWQVTDYGFTWIPSE